MHTKDHQHSTDIGLWCNFTSGAFAKLQSAYVKCVKIFFTYSKFYSVTIRDVKTVYFSKPVTGLPKPVFYRLPKGLL